MEKENSRRQSIKISSITGLSAALGMGVPFESYSDEIRKRQVFAADRKTLHVKPRYYRWHVDTGQE